MIVESHGAPKAVIISFSTYQQLQVLQEEQRRRAALDQLRQLRDEVRARKQGIVTEEQATAVAGQAVPDAEN